LDAIKGQLMAFLERICRFFSYTPGRLSVFTFLTVRFREDGPSGPGFVATPLARLPPGSQWLAAAAVGPFVMALAGDMASCGRT
jgi:hypothetical protein